MPLSRTAKIRWAVLVVLLIVLASLLVLIVLRPFGVRGPGEAALDYLRGNPYSRMTIEVDFVSSFGPDAASTGLLQTRVLARADKSAVDVFVDDALQPGDGGYSLEEIADLESAHRDRQTGGDTAVLYLLYVDGVFAEPTVPGSENALAVTYTASSVAVFKDRIRAADPPFPSPITARDIENAVLVHEFGHILGLVNLVYESAIAYEDAAHPNHSTNQSCVMYWAIEASGVGGLFGSAPPTDFGSEAADDLAKLKSGGYPVTPQRAPPQRAHAEIPSAREEIDCPRAPDVQTVTCDQRAP